MLRELELDKGTLDSVCLRLRFMPSRDQGPGNETTNMLDRVGGSIVLQDEASFLVGRVGTDLAFTVQISVLGFAMFIKVLRNRIEETLVGS